MDFVSLIISLVALVIAVITAIVEVRSWYVFSDAAWIHKGEADSPSRLVFRALGSKRFYDVWSVAVPLPLDLAQAYTPTTMPGEARREAWAWGSDDDPIEVALSQDTGVVVIRWTDATRGG